MQVFVFNEVIGATFIAQAFVSTHECTTSTLEPVPIPGLEIQYDFPQDVIAIIRLEMTGWAEQDNGDESVYGYIEVDGVRLDGNYTSASCSGDSNHATNAVTEIVKPLESGVHRFSATWAVQRPSGGDAIGHIVNNLANLRVMAFEDYFTGIANDPPPATTHPPRASLKQNYPNPFNPVTSIPFSVTSGGKVMLKIYDTRGHLVRTLLDEVKQPGNYKIVWDGKGETGTRLSSGNYFYQLEIDGFQSTRKMIILK